jgi:2-polyprenyl-3-methyl-5-hydroxy-6-metoxy-1,4-benzoquinol methylase
LKKDIKQVICPGTSKRPDSNLVSTIKNFNIKPGKGLDVGCGTGDNVIWLSRQGFKMTGIDFSKTAIELAILKAKNENINASFYSLDFLNDTIPGNPYSFVRVTFIIWGV